MYEIKTLLCITFRVYLFILIFFILDVQMIKKLNLMRNLIIINSLFEDMEVYFVYLLIYLSLIVIFYNYIMENDTSTCSIRSSSVKVQKIFD